jgi:hypothetical protein
MRIHWILPALICLFSCSTARKTTHSPVPGQLKYIGQYIVPHNMLYNGTIVGGLSGIDYDAQRQQYYLICDDRSALNPARFYTAKIHFTPTQLDSIQFIGVTTLRQTNGQPFPSSKVNPLMAPDPEAMRLNKKTGLLVWSSEGARIVNEKDTILHDPAIYEINMDGTILDSFAIPSLFRMQAAEKGARRNGTFEGLGFTPDNRYLYVSLEEPLYEDGPRADLVDNNAYIRIIKFDANTRQPIAQYGYKLDPVAHPAIPPASFKTNGISDILVLSDHQLLTLERSFSTGVKNCTIRLYLTNLEHATDVSKVNSLKTEKQFVPAQKRLLFNFDSLGKYIDNIEGVTFGPTLPNGHRTLIFVADNNFSDKEESQFFLFEVIP